MLPRLPGARRRQARRLRGRSRLSGDDSVTDVAEFFFARKYRGRGVGEAAARALAMMSKYVELVRAIYETVEAGDSSVLLGALADDVEWYEAENGPYWFGGVLIGGSAVIERVFSRLPQDFDDLRLHVRRVVGCGDTVLAEARYSAVGRATGLRLDAQVAHVWDFKDGKVIRWQQYTDTRQFAEVIGRSQHA